MTPLHEVLVGGYRQSMLLLFAAVVVVLAAALANLLSLALVRADGRRAELSVRMAIGASRLRLARQLAVEALPLALIGSGIGWMLAAQAIGAVVAWAPPSVPRLGEVTLDRSVFLFVAAVTVIATALLALARSRCAGARASRDATRLCRQGLTLPSTTSCRQEDDNPHRQLGSAVARSATGPDQQQHRLPPTTPRGAVQPSPSLQRPANRMS